MFFGKGKVIYVSCFLMFVSLIDVGFCAKSIKVWYPVTITMEGPKVEESSETFRDYRLDATFSKDGRELTVPGYFAADGNAANTSATGGNKWRVKFTPDEPGEWNYRISFRVGQDVAASMDKDAGEPGVLDGKSGSFTVEPADPQAPGFYSKGKLRYVGEHFLQFTGSGEWFVKAGVIYVIYSQSASNLELDLSETNGTFKVQWYNPVVGGDLRTGEVSTVKGGSKVRLGAPPDNGNEWVVLLTK